MLNSDDWAGTMRTRILNRYRELGARAGRRAYRALGFVGMSVVLPAGALVATVTAGASAASPTPRAVAAVAAAPQLHVSGNKLVDQSGTQVVLHGADRSGGALVDIRGRSGDSDQEWTTG
jgi:hypothetical protein